ncbi:odorant binding protein 12 precursor [Apis mellifera]|uniref:OBP12 n=1 Tax=Apis mellifera TaxID=7460 RepID=A0A7M6UQL4_APIME|nr:odorant binding protein 12 precursor [Apis mellifera]ABD92644.1 OBP12 [Apis mellifera]|eukprot:NP_001035319.1 odorant binding protein 12 precursor [Apis mellifera]
MLYNNLTIVIILIMCGVQNLRARSVNIFQDIADCVDRSNMTFHELKKLRDSSEARIKLINEEENFRNYGCFLACIWQQTGVMNGSELSTYNIAGIIEGQYHDDEDLKTFFHKIALTCEDDVHRKFLHVNDECDVALSFKLCMLKAMRNYP